MSKLVKMNFLAISGAMTILRHEIWSVSLFTELLRNWGEIYDRNSMGMRINSFFRSLKRKIFLFFRIFFFKNHLFLYFKKKLNFFWKIVFLFENHWISSIEIIFWWNFFIKNDGFFFRRSIVFDHMEIALHDVYGSREFWRARRSMRYNSELYEIANNFRQRELNSNDVDDFTERPDNWQEEKVRKAFS